MKILIAGDYAPNDRIQKLLNSCDYSFLDSVCQVTSSYDLSIVNLESPIVDGDSRKIVKSGPSLKTTPRVVDSIKYAGFSCVTLANNHFRDFGDEGVKLTLKTLNDAGVMAMGGGENLSESQKNLIVTIGDKKVGFINVCEFEFSIASTTYGGSAPLDIIDVSRRIRELNFFVDFVIVIIHGGHEHYQLPSPRMKKAYRFFVDEGADVIVNHHQHCYSGFELYKGKYIFYGLGNFCFDRHDKRNSIWNMGYMVGLTLDNKITFEIIPYSQCSNIPSVEILDNHNKMDILKNIENLNYIISDNERLEQEFIIYCNNRKHSIKSTFSPYNNRLLSGLAKYKIIPYLLPQNKVCNILDYVRCESHRDVVCHVLSRDCQ